MLDTMNQVGVQEVKPLLMKYLLPDLLQSVSEMILNKTLENDEIRQARCE